MRADKAERWMTITSVLPLSQLFEALKDVPGLANIELSWPDMPWSFGDLSHALVRADSFFDWAVSILPEITEPLTATLLAAIGDAKFIDLEN